MSRLPATTSETDASGKRVGPPTAPTATLPVAPPSVEALPAIDGYTSKGLPVYKTNGPGSIGYHLNILIGYPTVSKEYQKKIAAEYNAAVAWRNSREAAIAKVNEYNASMGDYNASMGDYNTKMNAQNKTLNEISDRKEKGRSLGMISEQRGISGGLINSIRGIGGIK